MRWGLHHPPSKNLEGLLIGITVRHPCFPVLSSLHCAICSGPLNANFYSAEHVVQAVLAADLQPSEGVLEPLDGRWWKKRWSGDRAKSALAAAVAALQVPVLIHLRSCRYCCHDPVVEVLAMCMQSGAITPRRPDWPTPLFLVIKYRLSCQERESARRGSVTEYFGVHAQKRRGQWMSASWLRKAMKPRVAEASLLEFVISTIGNRSVLGANITMCRPASLSA